MRKFYFLILVMLSPLALLAQIYVTETGAGVKNGSSWATAYDKTQLQLAINSAAARQQVWVAKGTYRPTENPMYDSDTFAASTDTRDKVFLMKRGVSIYGGFAGNETVLADRDLTKIYTDNKTVLSGDINGDDNPNNIDANKTDNTYHVVLVYDADNTASASTIDGFTITGGYANGTGTTTAVNSGTVTYDRGQGAGINLRGLGAYNVAYRNLVIENNKSQLAGGGMFLNGGGTNSYTIDKVTFKNNSAVTQAAALYISISAAYTVNITDTDFKTNTATAAGGAIYLNGALATLNMLRVNCDGNTSNTQGGAIYVNAGVLTINSSTFNGNTSVTAGGAITYAAASTLKVSKSKFYNNIATTNGGAIYQGGGASTAQIYNTVFYNNQSQNSGSGGGGAIYFGSSNTSSESLTAVNCTFYANKATYIGGAICFWSPSTNKSLYLYNNIFNANTATNSSNDVRNLALTATLKNNLLQTSVSNITNQTGSTVNASPSPLFASTTDTDYNFLYPVSGGISVDAGTEKDKDNVDLYANIVTEKDLLDNYRKQGAGIDLGAIEYSLVLPVTINSFTANLVNARTQLKWSVGTESNVNRYEVGRSQNGIDFIKVAEVSANGSVSYTAIDNNPQLGVNYYRLVAVDNDGSTRAYKDLQSVKLASLSTESVQVYPNPVKDNVINVALIGYAAGNYTYKLVNTIGVVVQQGNINYNGSKDLSISTIVPSGIYTLYLANANKTVTTKLIKQ